LVHCRLGVNRSVTVAAAFLMRRNRFSADQALQLLRERRPGAQPNEAYCEQLRQMPQSWEDGQAQSEVKWKIWSKDGMNRWIMIHDGSILGYV